ncbi:DUF2637 domain-containing protein [Tsukamurella strandjordii]|uniref:DUF2637 domain-containing protein n=1 Tax=Tsukamurella TaxID=2060 RepID=UPI001C7CE269|nr:DUF2637 domain-containing protein [Tsukamurella sp. TY48]GIZ97532.1 hypothetical protein TTY48_21440 [Tsukamurella sp. TY48]
MSLTKPVRRFLWVLLIAGTAGSVAANMAHAHPGIGPRIMAVAAPVALLAFTHLVGLWGRIRASGVTYWAILVTVALIAAGAARVSFAAVRDLAVSYGYGPLDAALFPLMLDGGLAVTALALVVLSRFDAEAATGADQAVDHPGDEASRSAVMVQPAREPVHELAHAAVQAAPTTRDIEVADTAPAVADEPVLAHAWSTMGHAVTSADDDDGPVSGPADPVVAQAADLVARDVVQVDQAVVEEVIRRLNARESVRSIAAADVAARGTVTKIRDALPSTDGPAIKAVA